MMESSCCNISIVKVTANDKTFLTTISKWIYNWWGKIEGYSLEEIKEFTQYAVYENRIPQTFVALKDGKPAGMYHILMSDCKVRPDIYPWLTDVYVAEEFRGQGIGKLLIQSVREKAKELDLEEIFLYTNLDRVYEKHGWIFLEYFNPYTSPKGEQKLYRLDINDK